MEALFQKKKNVVHLGPNSIMLSFWDCVKIWTIWQHMMLWWECVLKTLPEPEWGRSVIFLTLKIKHFNMINIHLMRRLLKRNCLHTQALYAHTL